jgi:DNA-binding PadR family transcriptional regulator
MSIEQIAQLLTKLQKQGYQSVNKEEIGERKKS